jgi:hypothetical protein
MKIGVGIVTFNSENYYKDLYNSLPFDSIDELVTVNGGDEYNEKYKNSDWIQHNKNRFPSVCRNDCITFLLNKDCEHIFIIEDDMIIKNKNIFKKYIEASKQSGLKYLHFVSTSWEAGTPGNRTPRLTVEYSKDVSISFYKNMCNEFTYHHKSCYEEVGIYDTQFRNPFDIDLAYRESKYGKYAAPFWWFADITNSDDYICNNPIAVSRLQAKDNPNSREKTIQKEWEKFIQKHGLLVNQIPDTSKNDVLLLLKKIKP